LAVAAVEAVADCWREEAGIGAQPARRARAASPGEGPSGAGAPVGAALLRKRGSAQ